MTEELSDPLPTENTKTIEATRDQLNLLGVFYILLAILSLPALFFLTLRGPILEQLLDIAQDQATAELYTKLVNTAFFGLAAMIVVHLLAFFYIGSCFRKQRRHTLCLIAAVFCCLSFPLGTILGIFSIIVLMKPEAKTLFGQEVQSA